MRCAADHGTGAGGRRHATPAACAALAAVLILLLAACTAGRTGGPAHHGQPAGPGTALGRRLAIARLRAGLGQGRVFIVGGLNGGAVIALPGAALLAPGLSQGGTRPQIVLPPVPPAGSTQAIAMPLDSYEQVASQQQETLATADDLLTQQCMQARGFSYPVAAQPGSGAALVRSIEDSGYGITSLAQAQAYGYGQPGSTGPGSTGQGTTAQAGPGLALPGFVQEMQHHGTAWTSALLGFVPGAAAGAPQREGCLQRADDELYGPVNGDSDPDPVPQLAAQAAQWTQSDPHVLAAERAWSRCMARRGFTDNTPAQAQQRNWPSTPSPVEIATAEADTSCKTAVNLVNTWLTVEAAYQQAMVAQNLTALSDLQANFGALLRRAEALLQAPELSGAGAGAEP